MKRSAIQPGMWVLIPTLTNEPRKVDGIIANKDRPGFLVDFKNFLGQPNVTLWVDLDKVTGIIDKIED